MNNIRISKAKIDHLESLGSLFDQYRQFYNQTPDLERSLSFIKERIERQDSVILIALNESGKVLGFAQLYPSFSSISTSKKWILNDVFVSSSSRRLGIAKMLMQRVEKLAKETGATSVFLEVQVDNENAQHLYKSCGYIEETEHYSYLLEIIE
jgi:ribosomal protein S18 acetylase RimI-like enzyme